MNPYIKVIGSGSSGNCLAMYNSKGKFILIDVGVQYKAILKQLDYNIENCIGVFVTHIHNDHSKAIKDFISLGIQVYGNEDICAKYPMCNRIDRILVYKDEYFTVKSFGVPHSVPNNGFLVDTCDGIRLLYITDAMGINYKFKDVNYAVIECNYCEDDIVENMVGGSLPKSMCYNHLELNRCVDYLKAIGNVNLQGVLLWHMSATNIDKEAARRKVQEELSFNNVYIARAGLQINTKREEF